MFTGAKERAKSGEDCAKGRKDAELVAIISSSVYILLEAATSSESGGGE